MNARELNAAIAAAFGVEQARDLRKTFNRAVRTLPGGEETLAALESLNAAKIHAERHHATDRVIATNAAINRVEEIRDAMESFVRRKAEAHVREG